MQAAASAITQATTPEVASAQATAIAQAYSSGKPLDHSLLMHVEYRMSWLTTLGRFTAILLSFTLAITRLAHACMQVTACHTL